jgi:hypothetical protein
MWRWLSVLLWSLLLGSCGQTVDSPPDVPAACLERVLQVLAEPVCAGIPDPQAAQQRAQHLLKDLGTRSPESKGRDNLPAFQQ